MMFNNKSLWGMFGLFAIAAPGFGGLTAPRSFLELEQNADLIVVGVVTGPFVAASVVNFSIRVDRVIKGSSALVGTAIQVSGPGVAESAMAPGSTINPTGSGLWFLRQSSNAWALLPFFQGNVAFDWTFFAVPAGPILSAYAYDPAASLSDKVASEISAAIEGAGAAVHLKAYLHDLLDQLQSPVVGLLYQRLSNSTSPQQRILGLTGLIRGDNSGALAAAAQLATSLGSYPVENGILLTSITHYFRAADPASIGILGGAAADSADPNLPFRQAAAAALAAIHTAAALPYLASLLDDPNPPLQAQGIRGLGSFANGLPTQTQAGVPGLAHLQLPTTAPYRTDETMRNFALNSDFLTSNLNSYLPFWKQWWAANRSALGY